MVLPAAPQKIRLPAGTISPHTVDLLIEAGYEYFGNGLADDIPHYWVSEFTSRRALLTLPYYYHFDDQFFLLFPRKGTGLENADMLLRNWKAEFDAQYRRGRLFHMTLHPQGIGWCNRVQVLDDFLGHMRESRRPVESDRCGVRAILARDVPGTDPPAPGTQHLAGLCGEFELRLQAIVARSARD